MNADKTKQNSFGFIVGYLRSSAFIGGH